MLKRFLLSSVIAIPAFAMAQPTIAAQNVFSPLDSCTTVLKLQPNDAGLWAFGYLSHLEGASQDVTEESMAELLAGLSTVCEPEPDASFDDVVEAYVNPPAMAPTSADPQALLDVFANEGGDMREILIAMKPTPEDVRALFAEPLASEMIEMYDELFGTRLATEDFPSPFSLLTSSFTTTKSLANDPLLEELPGGFQKVVDLYLEDVPFGVVRILFPTVSDDMKLEGFVYVNGHWVLMSSPWRAL